MYPETIQCECCGERFQWEPTMYRLCGFCLHQMEAIAAAHTADDAST